MVILKTGEKITVKASRDIINSPVTNGFTQEEYEKGLRERGAEIQESLRQIYESQLERAHVRTSEEVEKRASLELEFNEVQRKLANIDVAYKAVTAQLHDAQDTIKALENRVPSVQLEAAKQAIEEGPEAAYETFIRIADSGKKDIALAYFEAARLAESAIRYEDALRHYREAVVLEGQNPLYLNDAGTMAQKLGRYDEADRLLWEALEISQRVLGEEHPDTAVSYNNVAYNLNAQGRYEEAEPLYRKGLEIRQRVLGEEHPSTAASYNNVASNLNAQGRYEEAEPLYRKAVELIEIILGPGHPNSKIMRDNLSLFLKRR